jgi:predicted kinase
MKQQLIVMAGLPGSGKSAIAEAIAAQLNLPLLSVDPIESAIIKAGIAKSFRTGLAAYLVAKELAAKQFKVGNSVIIDAVNAEEEAKNTWRGLAKDLELSLTVIETTLDEAEHKKRIESRMRNLHGLPEVTWDKVIERRKLYTRWKEPILRLDSSAKLSESINLAIQHIESERF